MGVFCFILAIETENILFVIALESFEVEKNIEVNKIKNVKVHRSQLYARGPVYTFDYKDNHFYLMDDYSLSDNPRYLQDIFE